METYYRPPLWSITNHSLVSDISKFYENASIIVAGDSGFIGRHLSYGLHKLYSLHKYVDISRDHFNDLLQPIDTVFYCVKPSPFFSDWWSKNYSKIKNIVYLQTSAIGSTYALAKQQEVKMIKESDVNLYLYTLPSIYGPLQRRGMLIPNLIMNSIEGIETEVDECLRSYLHIDELTENLLADYYFERKKVVYGGETQNSLGVANFICSRLNGRYRVRNRDYDVLNEQETGIPFHLGLLETIAWYQYNYSVNNAFRL